ncbi:peptidoglycan-binding domain-containing protein [Streptomyces sp. WM6372]|uniref:peptidoglycan-binding domain-containing protein n=1 Tax=Streptomyces sp. WM6372 TaxID=1415555 RepID=UPI00099B291B|nr:peptidoglycan-binding protein [Streptomyces sp. WM6372]
MKRWPRTGEALGGRHFGPATKAQVVWFQSRLGLAPDGIVGPETGNRVLFAGDRYYGGRDLRLLQRPCAQRRAPRGHVRPRPPLLSSPSAGRCPHHPAGAARTRCLRAPAQGGTARLVTLDNSVAAY